MPRLTESERTKATDVLEKLGVNEIAAFLNTRQRNCQLLLARFHQNDSVKKQAEVMKTRARTSKRS